MNNDVLVDSRKRVLKNTTRFCSRTFDFDMFVLNTQFRLQALDGILQVSLVIGWLQCFFYKTNNVLLL